MKRFVAALIATALTAGTGQALPSPEEAAVDLKATESGVLTNAEVNISPELVTLLSLIAPPQG